jgi:dimethylargininase
VFIEDTAVVLDEAAIVTRPGAASRRAEVDAVEAALARYRPVRRIAAPATLDGGDVLRIGRVIYVGVSGRTNDAGVRQLADIAAPFGYAIVPVEGLGGCLHLKSAATDVDDGVVIVNPEWIDPSLFRGLTCIEVDPEEPHAANTLRLGRRVLCAASAPRTAARLDARGIETLAVDVSELAKAEGALTCCSVIVARGTQG